MEYIKIRSWEKWQTYRRDRGQPPWIKVHRSLMRNQEWVALTDEERGQLVAMWLLAADRNGVIPASPTFIQKICFMSTEPDLSKFVKLGFICDNGVIPASPRRQDDQPKAETEKIRIEKKDFTKVKSMSNNGCVFCVFQTYCQIMDKNPNQYKLTEQKKKKIKARLRDSTAQEIYQAIKACKDSNYHMGQNDDGKLYNDLLKNIIPSRE